MPRQPRWQQHVLSQPAASLPPLQVDTAAVLKEVSSLPVPQDWVDPVTQVRGQGEQGRVLADRERQV